MACFCRTGPARRFIRRARLRCAALNNGYRGAQITSYPSLLLACHVLACSNPPSKPKSKVENGFNVPLNLFNTPFLAPNCSPKAPSIARTRGGSESAIFNNRSIRPFSPINRSVRSTVPSGESSLVPPPHRKNSSSAASSAASPFHASGRRPWITVSAPINFRGRLSAQVETSARLPVCVENPSKLAAANPEGKIVLCRAASR